MSMRKDARLSILRIALRRRGSDTAAPKAAGAVYHHIELGRSKDQTGSRSLKFENILVFEFLEVISTTMQNTYPARSVPNICEAIVAAVWC